MKRSWLRAAGCLALLSASPLVGCKAPARGPGKLPLPADESNYSYAVYDDTDALMHSPIEHLEREIADRAARGEKPISDLYVLVHGWDFTVEEAFALYEGYRTAIRWRLDKIQRFDPDYQPWFVFVIWSSVSRPLTSTLRSVLPFPPPDLAEGATSLVDRIAFHLPSAWGESQDAARLAMGPPLRWSSIDFERDGHEEYVSALEHGTAMVAAGGFRGFEIPVSLLLEELVHLQRTSFGLAPPALHLVGHSFGAKLVSLAAYDAIQRITGRELARGEPLSTGTIFDSLVMILPAMQATEMYWELPLPLEPAVVAAHEGAFRQPRFASMPALRFERAAARIATKVLIHSKHDSANGWVYGLGDVLLDHDAAARAQEMLARESERPLPPPRTVGQRIISFPFDLCDRTLQVVVRGGAIVVQTVISDVGAIWDGLAESGADMVEDVDDPLALLADVVTLPLSPLLTQRSIGNRGFTRPRSTVSRLDARTWLDDGACEFLEGSQQIDADDLMALSVTLGTPPSPETPDRYFVADARKLYPGPLPAGLSDVIPPGAHGDLRSTDEIEGPGPIRLAKRDRTMNLLYNVTRGPRLARGTVTADSPPQK